MTETLLTCFADLLNASHQQPEPQRLLFVFTRAEMPDGATEAQRREVAAGEGGNLTPELCVDKAPEEIDSFQGLVAESAHADRDWDVVFVGSLSGRGGIPPSADEAEQPLQMMVSAVREGRIASFAAFNRSGEVLSFQ